MTQYDPAWPHGELQQVFPNIFMVTGTNKTTFKKIRYQFSRNMVVVREGGALTLINTVRLNDDGLKKLDALGAVKNIVRIGAFHGRDDPFYLDHYPNAEHWIMDGIKLKGERQADHILSANSATPFQGCTVFNFNLPKFSEGILCIDQHHGILITCDSIQNFIKTDRYFNFITRIVLHYRQQIGCAKIAPIWFNACHPTAEDFKQLLTLPFKHLISAHGEPLLNEAHDRLAESIKKTFNKSL